jgi:FixJ family two-component response regulator
VDYVIKPVSPDTLLDVVRRAAAQQVLFDKDANA